MARQALERCKAELILVLTCMLLPLRNAWDVPLNLYQWVKMTWCERVDVETTRSIQPGGYPNRMADLHLEMGLARLSHQHTQAAAFDHKLAVAGSLSLAIIALVPIAFASTRSPEIPAGTSIIFAVLVAAGLAVLLLASLSSIKGLWPRTYRSLPDLQGVRNQIGNIRWSNQDIRWSIAASQLGSFLRPSGFESGRDHRRPSIRRRRRRRVFRHYYGQSGSPVLPAALGRRHRDRHGEPGVGDDQGQHDRDGLLPVRLQRSQPRLLRPLPAGSRGTRAAALIAGAAASGGGAGILGGGMATADTARDRGTGRRNHPVSRGGGAGAGDGIRTRGPLLGRQMLYP